MADPDNPYGDPFADEPPERIDVDDPDGLVIAQAAGELTTIRAGATVLKAVAAVATGLWLLAVITVFWNYWQLTDNGDRATFTAGPMPGNRILQVLSNTLGSTWGYLLVAVLAYTGAMVLHGQRMRLLIDAASAADD